LHNNVGTSSDISVIFSKTVRLSEKFVLKIKRVFRSALQFFFFLTFCDLVNYLASYIREVRRYSRFASAALWSRDRAGNVPTCFK